MLKKILNEIIIQLHISPDGPVLIKSGGAWLGTDMTFVRARRNGKTEVYLPGSSLKGVIRSHCEKICRTLESKSVCDPFENDSQKDSISCSNIFKDKKMEEKKYYSLSCPACRMFGSLNFRGRCFIDDAYAVGESPEPHIRDGVAIDRFTGAAKGTAKYDYEVITEGTFETQLHLVNFEMWQLELLIFTLSDLCKGNIRIGMGSSRGLGKIKVDIKKVEYHQLGRKPKDISLSDISILEENEKDDYGFYNSKVSKVNIQEIPKEAKWVSGGSIRYVLDIPGKRLLEEVAQKIRGVLGDYLSKNPNRKELLKERK